jgi:hypothetical protein
MTRDEAEKRAFELAGKIGKGDYRTWTPEVRATIADALQQAAEEKPLSMFLATQENCL